MSLGFDVVRSFSYIFLCLLCWSFIYVLYFLYGFVDSSDGVVVFFFLYGLGLDLGLGLGPCLLSLLLSLSFSR